MKKNPTASNEQDRLKALDSYSIMDTLSEIDYDSITQLASYICNTPISLVSLLDKDRQWFKSSVGLEVKETPKSFSFCQYAIMGDEVYEVQNALEDTLFSDNPLVTGNPDIRFYAGAPLKDSEGYNLGTLCVIDTVPRELTDLQKNALKLLANQVINLLQLRRKNLQLIDSQKEFKNFVELSKDLVCIANIDGTFHKVNPTFITVLGYSREELEGKLFVDFIHPDDLEKTYKEVEKLANGEKTLSFVNRYKCKNGAYISLSWRSTPDPETGNLYSIARDITLEIEKQEELINISTELSAILNATEFSIISSDLDGVIKQFNRGAEKLLGYKAEDVEGKITPEIFHIKEEVVKRAEELSIELGREIEPGYDTFVVKAREFGIADSQEWSYVRKDGTTFPMRLSVTAIKNKEGEITGYLGIAKDVTKEKEAELNLLNSNKLLDEAESIAKTGSWKFDLKSNNLIWSKGHYAIFEFEQITVDKLNEAYRSRIYPDDLSILDELSNNILKTGEDFKINYRIIFPDNRIKYILEIGAPYKNEKGEIIGLQGSVQDVTEKTIAEQKIQEKSKEVLDIRAALDESSIVSITDVNGVFTFVNDNFCKISKYNKDELIGQNQRMISNYLPVEFAKNILREVVNGKIWKGNIRNRAKDGSLYWEKTAIVPFTDTNGKVYQYIAISADISQQKLAQENLKYALIDLEKNNKELDQFAYVVSHDLKAPLRAINNLAEWIVEDMPEMPEDVKNNLGLLRGRILRMENLINGVLDYSRIGRTHIEMETIDIKLMLDQIVETIVPNKDFEVSIADKIPQIFDAKILLYQVFSNIIGNAVKYNDKEIGEIECVYIELPDFHQFKISDNGPGIPKEYQERVFGVFQTIEARDKKESTGIGLSIVKKIIEEKGGDIYIESVESSGTSFIFTIPK
ncbi:PAS domain S-box protein [Flavobacterium sp. WC2430]|uniref:PAS domain S-box protein n=1 Tax=Flavobacterium sp. WC2430 TaxID=3234137 RepID=UPI00346573C7